MADEFRRLNERARQTGQTHAEILREVRDALLAGTGEELKGIRRWWDNLRHRMRRPTATDRENRRIYEENRRRVEEEGPAAGLPDTRTREEIDREIFGDGSAPAAPLTEEQQAEIRAWVEKEAQRRGHEKPGRKR